MQMSKSDCKALHSVFYILRFPVEGGRAQRWRARGAEKELQPFVGSGDKRMVEFTMLDQRVTRTKTLNVFRGKSCSFGEYTFFDTLQKFCRLGNYVGRHSWGWIPEIVGFCAHT